MTSRYKSLKHKFTFVVLGRSGSGKGTQAKFLLRHLGKGAQHFETGRFLRAVIKKRNPTTLIARRVMGSGRLFPAWFAAYTWLKELIEKGHADMHLVYDGAPRRVWEAELIDEVMRWHGRPLPWCIYVDVTPGEAKKRLLRRGRADDSPGAIRNRMQFFSRWVLPVIAYYRARGRLIRVDGNPPPEVVWQEIRRTLERRFDKKWASR